MFENSKENIELMGLSRGLIIGMLLGISIALFSKNTYRVIIIFSCLGGLLGFFFMKLKNYKIES